EDCSEDSFEPYVPREVGLGVDFEDESTDPSRSRGTDLEIDVDVERSDEIKIDPEIQAEIDEYFAYADALRDRWIDARVKVEAIDREEIETGMRGPVKEGAVEVTYETLGDLAQRFHDHTGEILRELGQIRRFRFYDRMRIARLEACTRRHLGYPSRTREGVNEQSDRRMAETLRVRDTVKNLGPLMGNEGEKEEVNRNGGNGNGNENGGEYGYNFRGFMPAGECTYQDFLKCQPLNFTGTEGVVGLTHYALTWWNSHKRTIKIEAAYAMSWAELIKLMTKVYCPINKVQKIETELWNLAVKGNDLTAYTRRFQELGLLCTRMVPTEEDKVERFVGGSPDNIQWNVIAAEPTKLQYAICVANNLMDQKLKGYTRSAENKRRLDNNTRYNHGQLQFFKRQNVGEARNCGKCIQGGGQCGVMVFMDGIVRRTVIQTLRDLVGKSNQIVVMSVEGQDILGRIVLSSIRHDYSLDLGVVSMSSSVWIGWRSTMLMFVTEKSKNIEDKSEEKRLEDVPIVREFPEVFLEDLPGFHLLRKDHEGHLKLILRLLKKGELYAKFSKCEFWLSK
ncbi:putative reverse transcriptase domain-containing protein, partial [Tanacetum coccineum]